MVSATFQAHARRSLFCLALTSASAALAQTPEASPIVINSPAGPVVAMKDGTPIDGLKLSQHDSDILSPSMVVTADNTIHVAFVEKHRTTYQYALYYTASTDGGKTFSTPKNLSEVLPGYIVGNGSLAADAQGRIYAVWRTGLKETFAASPDPHAGGHANLVFRVLSGGTWTAKTIAVHPPGSVQNQDNGSLAYFVCNDATPKQAVHVIWNTSPDRFHPEVMSPGDGARSHLSTILPGLIFQSDLDGTTLPTPREIHMAKVTSTPAGNGWDKTCDGYDTMNGYIDANGTPHYLSQILSNTDKANHFHLFEGVGNAVTESPVLDLPGELSTTWHFPPKLLLDAQGKQHLIYLAAFGEQPSIRDQLIGSPDEPAIIHKAAAVKGTTDSFQAFQGAAGRMVVLMQMNDTGLRGDGETYLSVSTGHGTWSPSVNITNNAGRKSFSTAATSIHSSLSTLHRTYPGPTAAAYDRQGHLLLVHIASESTVIGAAAFGTQTFGGESTTPTLRFLKF